MEYSGAGGKLIHEKIQKQKISWYCPFKLLPREHGIVKKPSQATADTREQFIPNPSGQAFELGLFWTRQTQMRTKKYWDFCLDNSL